MELRRGITGIQGRKDPPPEPPLSNLKAFRSHCHAAAREVGARLGAVQGRSEALGACNYAIARFEFSDSTIAVLLNAVHPILAFARWPAEGQVAIEFVDCPKLAEVFQTLGGYETAASEELNQPLVRKMCKHLTPTEQRRVRYFRPRRVGDVIFNYWD
jgi:hypothetical protein